MARMPPMNAMRFNEGKSPLHWILTAPDGVDAVCRVFGFGAGKYAPDNWKLGLDEGEIIDSLLRHLSAYQAGEITDPESGLPTLAHMAWNAIVLCDQSIRHQKALAKANGSCYCADNNGNCSFGCSTEVE